MRISTVILPILFIWSCANTGDSKLSTNTDITADTIKTSLFLENLHWTRVEEYLEYALLDSQPPFHNSLPIQVEILGFINHEGQFLPNDTASHYTVSEGPLFGWKEVDDLIENIPGNEVYIKLKTDYIANQRRDLLKTIFILPEDGLTQVEFDQFISDLDDLDYIEQTEVTKQINSFMVEFSERDSNVIVQLRVTLENRNVDSLKSKIIHLTKDKRVGYAFYNDLIEQTRGQHLLMLAWR